MTGHEHQPTAQKTAGKNYRAKPCRSDRAKQATHRAKHRTKMTSANPPGQNDRAKAPTHRAKDRAKCLTKLTGQKTPTHRAKERANLAEVTGQKHQPTGQKTGKRAEMKEARSGQNTWQNDRAKAPTHWGNDNFFAQSRVSFVTNDDQ